MGGSGTAVTGDDYKASDVLKDYATVVGTLAAAVGAAAAVPGPHTPVLAGVACGMAVGAALVYSAGAITDASGY